MTITLDKDLCFFDIESTGLNVLRDRILQLAIIKYPKNNKPVEELSLLINPGVPISEEARDLVSRILTGDPAARPTLDQICIHPFMTNV